MTGEIEFKNGLPFAAAGFGVRRNFYASGRISAKVSDIAGVFELDYVGRQHFKNQRFYSAGEQCTFQRCMVVQALVDGRPCRLTFENTTHYPFGYASECTLEGVKLRHELVLDRNALFRRVTVLDNPEGKEVRCRLVQMNPGMGQGAKWRKAVRPDGSLRLVAEARFEGGASVAMEIGAVGPVALPDNSSVDPRAFPRSPDHTQEFRFDMEERGNRPVHLFWWVFDKNEDEELSSARVDRVFEDFRARRAADARFETGDAFADGHLGFVPAVAAAMEVDGAGAFRASPTYWVWGWDALVHSGPLAFTGRAAEVRRMLAFFRDTAGDGGRICHAYATDFGKHDADVSDPGEVNFDAVNSSFWLILLADYVAATGDESFKAECMRFARPARARRRAALRAVRAMVRARPRAAQHSPHRLRTMKSAPILAAFAAAITASAMNDMAKTCVDIEKASGAKSAKRDDADSVVAAVGEVANGRDDREEGRLPHLARVDDASELLQRGRALVDQFLPAKFQLDESVAAVSEMDDGVALQPVRVPVVEYGPVQGLCVYAEVADGHRLENESERGKVVHQVGRSEPKCRGRYGRIDEIPGVACPHGRLASEIGAPCRHVLDREDSLQGVEVGANRRLAEPARLVGGEIGAYRGCRGLRSLEPRIGAYEAPCPVFVAVHAVGAGDVAPDNGVKIGKRDVERRFRMKGGHLGPSAAAGEVGDFVELAAGRRRSVLDFPREEAGEADAAGRVAGLPEGHWAHSKPGKAPRTGMPHFVAVGGDGGAGQDKCAGSIGSVNAKADCVPEGRGKLPFVHKARHCTGKNPFRRRSRKQDVAIGPALFVDVVSAGGRLFGSRRLPAPFCAFDHYRPHDREAFGKGLVDNALFVVSHAENCSTSPKWRQSKYGSCGVSDVAVVAFPMWQLWHF